MEAVANRLSTRSGGARHLLLCAWCALTLGHAVSQDAGADPCNQVICDRPDHGFLADYEACCSPQADPSERAALVAICDANAGLREILQASLPERVGNQIRYRSVPLCGTSVPGQWGYGDPCYTAPPCDTEDPDSRCSEMTMGWTAITCDATRTHIETIDLGQWQGLATMPEQVAALTSLISFRVGWSYVSVLPPAICGNGVLMEALQSRLSYSGDAGVTCHECARSAWSWDAGFHCLSREERARALATTTATEEVGALLAIAEANPTSGVWAPRNGYRAGTVGIPWTLVDPCQGSWAGVTCDDAGEHVVSLARDLNAVPEQFTALTSLNSAFLGSSWSLNYTLPQAICEDAHSMAAFAAGGWGAPLLCSPIDHRWSAAMAADLATTTPQEDIAALLAICRDNPDMSYGDLNSAGGGGRICGAGTVTVVEETGCQMSEQVVYNQWGNGDPCRWPFVTCGAPFSPEAGRVLSIDMRQRLMAPECCGYHHSFFECRIGQRQGQRYQWIEGMRVVPDEVSAMQALAFLHPGDAFPVDVPPTVCASRSAMAAFVAAGWPAAVHCASDTAGRAAALSSTTQPREIAALLQLCEANPRFGDDSGFPCDSWDCRNRQLWPTCGGGTIIHSCPQIGLGGGECITSNQWGNGDPCSDEWAYVTCDATKTHITGLELRGIYSGSHGLEAELFLGLGLKVIPEQVGDLASLSTLDLRGNFIRSLPATVEALPLSSIAFGSCYNRAWHAAGTEAACTSGVALSCCPAQLGAQWRKAGGSCAATAPTVCALTGFECAVGYYSDIVNGRCIECPPSGVGQTLPGVVAAIVAVAAFVALYVIAGNQARARQGVHRDVIIFAGTTAGKESAVLRCALLKCLESDEHLVHVESGNDLNSPIPSGGCPATLYIVTGSEISNFIPQYLQTQLAREGIKPAVSENLLDTFLKLPMGERRALTTGSFMILGTSASSTASMRDDESFRSLTDVERGLGLGKDQLYALEDGAVPTELTDAVKQFVEEERRSSAHRMRRQKFRKSFLSMAGNASEIRNQAETERTGINTEAYAETTPSSLLRIYVPHVQIVAWSWSLDWQWPDEVMVLRQWIGSFIQLDINTIVKPECLEDTTGVSRESTPVAVACGLMLIILILVGLLALKRKCTKDNFKKKHVVCYLVMCWTYALPVAVVIAVRWLGWTENPSRGGWASTQIPNIVRARDWQMQLAVGVSLVWLLILAGAIPYQLYKRLRRARTAGRLRDADVFVPLGFLYEKFHEGAVFHELVCSEQRLFLLITGALLSSDYFLSQSACIGATVVALVIQFKVRPFAEPVDHEGKWFSLNRQALVALQCQLLGMLLGLVTSVVHRDSTGLRVDDGASAGSAIAVCAVALLSLFLPVCFGLICWRRMVELKKTAVQTVEGNSKAASLTPSADSTGRAEPIGLVP